MENQAALVNLPLLFFDHDWIGETLTYFQHRVANLQLKEKILLMFDGIYPLLYHDMQQLSM